MDNTTGLGRFLYIQETTYSDALAEMRAGRKQGHWIWFIFPQLKGLGKSFNADLYGIDGIEEAKAYLAHPVLGHRLTKITEAILALRDSDPVYLMHGRTDAMKLHSSMTLFACISGEDSVFRCALDKFYSGKPDYKTLEMLGRDSL